MLLLYILVNLVCGAPLYNHENARLVQTRQSTPPICKVDGNADFYGLGIRIGIYLQWLASLLANQYVPDAVRNLLMTNTIFLLAIFTVMCQATGQGTLQQAEAITLQHLCFGFLFSILSIWGYRVRARIEQGIAFSLAGTSFRLGLASGICAYGVWFWFAGNDWMSNEDCSAVTFLFTKVDVEGPVKHFYQVQAIVLLAVYGSLMVKQCLTWLVSALRSIAHSAFPAAVMTAMDQFSDSGGSLISAFFHRWSQTAPIQFWITINGGRFAEDTQLESDFPFLNGFLFTTWMVIQFLCLFLFKRALPFKAPPKITYHGLPLKKSELEKHPWASRLNTSIRNITLAQVLTALNVVCVGWAILSTELTLAWNRISGVYSLQSVGQLIPFIIGIVSFLQILYTLVRDHYRLALTDMILTSFVCPKNNMKAPSRNGDAEPERYPLRRGFDTVFWRNAPKRRRSFDILMPDSLRPDMTICVSPPDVAEMGLVLTRHRKAHRRRSFSHLDKELSEIREDLHKQRQAEMPRVVQAKEPKHKKLRLAINVLSCSFGVLFVIVKYFSKGLFRLLGICVPRKRFAFAVGGMIEIVRKSLEAKWPSVRPFGPRPPSPAYSPPPIHERRVQTLSPSPISDHHDSRESANRSSYAARTDRRVTFASRPRRRRASSPPSLRTSMSTQSSSLSSPSPRSSSYASSISTIGLGPHNWGPHLIYYPPVKHPPLHFFPDGPLRVTLRILNNTAAVCMPMHPTLSRVSVIFADKLAELHAIWWDHRQGHISRAVQDARFKRWLDEIQGDRYLDWVFGDLLKISLQKMDFKRDTKDFREIARRVALMEREEMKRKEEMSRSGQKTKGIFI